MVSMVSKAVIAGVVLLILCVSCAVASFFLFPFSFKTDEPPQGSKPLGKFLYDELKCSPIFDEKSHTITSFNCNGTIQAGHCIFEGEHMRSGDVIQNIHTDTFCRSRCPCDKGGNLLCTEDDCESRKEVQLYQKHIFSTEKCCPEKFFEDSPFAFADGPKLKPSKFNCTMGNETYREGSRMRHDETCSSCICEEGFTGKIEEPYCIKRRCLQQIFHPNEMANNCAAVYVERDQCCPTLWLCNEGQEIVKMNNDSISKPGVLCDFGTDEVPYGYGFEKAMRVLFWDSKVRCECTLPPFLTCIAYYQRFIY